MGRIPDNVVEQVRERADIVQIVGRHVTLKKVGPRHWGLCPFHDEKTPSFQVHEDKQIFYCFGCAAGGDVFAFRMRHEGVEFPDAIRLLAREVGVEIPEAAGDGGGRSGEIYKINERAAEYFKRVLRSPEGAAARRYLEEREIPEDLIERFSIGFAPARWDGLVEELRRAGALKVGEQAGLIGQRQTGDGHYDRFRGRIIFPIAEPGGNVIGFGGRVLGKDDGPKYLNSPESPVYRKSRVLFGLPLALDATREAGKIVVVEGYFDLVALHRAGIRNGVAPCGTALGREHARRLRRYAQEVVLLFDGDDAGQAAAERALPGLLAEGLRVRAAFLPPGEDPDTLLVRSGAAALRACIESAVPLLDHLIERALKGGAGHAWDTADAARRIEAYLKAIPDPVERAHYVRQFSSYADLAPDVLQQAIGAPEAAESATSAQPAGKTRPVRVDATTRVLLGALGAFPHLLPLLDQIEAGWMPAGDDRDLIERLSAAMQEEGQSAIAQLLSPASESLSEEQKAAFSRILAEEALADAAVAERAVRDCVARLGDRALKRRSLEIQAQLSSCSPDEESALLEEKQAIGTRRTQLRSQVHQL